MPIQQRLRRAEEGESVERTEGAGQETGGIDRSISQSEPSSAPCHPFSISEIRSSCKGNPKSRRFRAGGGSSNGSEQQFGGGSSRKMKIWEVNPQALEEQESTRILFCLRLLLSTCKSFH